jgi:hypothetical protein
MLIEDYETYAIEGIDGAGLKKAGKVIYAPVPPEAQDAPEEAKQMSAFLALLHELIQETAEEVPAHGGE